MPPTPKYDYRALQDEFVRGSMSVRELARMHDIPDSKVSSLHDQARKHEWERLRLERQTKADDKTIDLIADGEAKRRARRIEVREHAIEAVDRYITRMIEDLDKTKTVERHGELIEEPLISTSVSGLSTLIDRLSLVLGEPSEKGEGAPRIDITAIFGGQGFGPAAAGPVEVRTPGRPEPKRVGPGSPLPSAPDPGEEE